MPDRVAATLTGLGLPVASCFSGKGYTQEKINFAVNNAQVLACRIDQQHVIVLKQLKGTASINSNNNCVCRETKN